MSSFAIVTRASDAPLWSGLAEFEVALTRAFPDVRVIGRRSSAVETIEWTRGDHQSTSWMDGSINEGATAIYLTGDDRLVYETALWLQSATRDAVLTWDWQGIPFDLNRIESVERLIVAVEQGDESVSWRPGSRDIPAR